MDKFRELVDKNKEEITVGIQLIICAAAIAGAVRKALSPSKKKK